MANSKSNIYPIQLQGAELNLNKLDAEIKQYSGFNKNNSPFVGGCLSNVFHKEEQITGGNADNTYIDVNGDVYTFEENNDKFEFVKYSSNRTVRTVISEYNKRTIKHELIDLPKNTVYYYDAGECGVVWVTYSNDIFSIHYKKGDTELTKNIEPQYVEGQTIYKDVNSYFFNAKCYEGNVYISFLCNISVASNIVGRTWFIGIHTEIDEPVMTEILENKICIYEGVGGPVSNTAILKDDFSSRIWFFVGTGNAGDNSSNTYKCFLINPDTFAITTRVKKGNLFDLSDLNVNYENYDFFIADNVNGEGYAAYLIYANTTGANTDKYYYMKSHVQVGAENQSIYKIKITENLKVELNTARKADLRRIKPSSMYRLDTYGAIYGIKYYLSDTSAFGWGVCDKLTTNVTGVLNGENVDCFNFMVGGIVSKNILFNNGLITGICSDAGILLTEWNSIDERCVFPQNEGELKYVYRNINDKKYYAIKYSSDKPVIKCFNNQLVFNIDSVNNSYDLRSDELKTFAFAWNNRAMLRDSIKFNTSYEVGKDTLFASSVNEYDLANNASLILNPVSVVDDFNNITRQRQPVISKNELTVNYYQGKEQVLYFYSETLTKPEKYFKDEELIGLPFPTNTDGNVQYSPSLFCEMSFYGNDGFIKEGSDTYQLMKSGNNVVFSYFLGTLVEGLNKVFIIQGQYYGIINNQVFALQFNNGVIANIIFIVDISNLQFVGNTPYEALFFSKTNRCLYSFTGANVLNQKQLVDKISEVRNYLYNPATQTVFLITDIGVLFYGLFGMFLLEYTNITNIFLLDNGIVMSDNSGNYRYIKYYLDEGDEGYTKENIRLETCFYGMNNEVVTINDCLYFRLFSEEHEEGDLKVKATTISLKGRQTEETTFKIKASDWDKITHTIYLRYQPKTQRGLGVSFSIDSPFKIASMSVGSQPDAVLVDKVSKGAITAPSVTTNNNEW